MSQNSTPIKKKADLGAIAFAKVMKLEKRVTELEKLYVQPTTETTNV